MTVDWQALAAEVIASLSHDEREASIAYIEQHVIRVGEALSLAGTSHCFDQPVVIAFVDLEPALNWTHQGRYLVLGAEGGIRKKVDTDLPPFLTRVSPHLRVIHVGSQAPGWATATEAVLE